MQRPKLEVVYLYGLCSTNFSSMSFSVHSVIPNQRLVLTTFCCKENHRQNSRILKACPPLSGTELFSFCCSYCSLVEKRCKTGLLPVLQNMN